jgi:hypothetical protein
VKKKSLVDRSVLDLRKIFFQRKALPGQTALSPAAARRALRACLPAQFHRLNLRQKRPWLPADLVAYDHVVNGKKEFEFNEVPLLNDF